MLSKSESQNLFETLSALGGKAFKEEDITYEGTKIQLPADWSGRLPKAVKFLQSKMAEEEAIAAFTRTYNYRPWDGAYNAFQAMKHIFGLVQGKAIPATFFTPEVPPQYISVPISVDQVEEVPWGRFQLPLFENTDIYFGGTINAEHGECFEIRIDSPRKNRFAIEGLFAAIGKEIEEHSIYRGKAIDGQNMPQFIDLSGVRPERVIYDEQVKAELEANVWGFMRHNETFAKLGMPTKRSILLEGYYGTGKTLTANVTALEAVKNGWTFIMARPGRDNFFDVMKTARLYQPAVVFMEDADAIAHENENDSISQLLDVFDGIQAKNTKLLVVLTTNHRDTLTEGMRRPGRIDQIIHIGKLDRAGIEAMIRMVLAEKLDPKTNFDKVAEACEGFYPAFIKEAADRSIRYAVVRLGGEHENVTIGTDDLVFAARSMAEHVSWMGDEVKHETEDRVGASIAKVVKDQTTETVLALVAENPNASVWDPARVTALREAAHAQNKQVGV